MHILVSFCNRTGPGDPALGLLDADFSDFRVLKLPAAMSGCIGVTGLATCGRRLYIVAQALPRWQDHPGAPAAPTETAAWVQQLSPPHLFMFDLRTFSLRSYYAFQSAQDVHSIAVLDNDVYAVSSGTDAVIKLGIRDGIVLSESVVWRPDMQLPPADLHHLNAILAWRGELIVTGFGKKADQLWSSARDGFVVNINTGARIASGIEHPHSVINIGDDFAYCESRRMSVLTLSKDRSQFLPGYTRGLCLAGTKLYAGTSVGRAESKSTGVVNNPGDSGVAAGCCSVSRLSRESFQVERTFNLDDYGREIYDLLPIDNVSEWRV